MIRATRLLNLRRIRQQPLRALLAILAIAGGVALGTSILIVTGSVSHSFAAFGRALGGPAQLRVVGATARGGLDETLLGKVERTPGVAAAVPVVQAVTLAETGSQAAGSTAPSEMAIVALGVDCRIEAFAGPFGCSPEAVASAADTAPPFVSSRLAKRLGTKGAVRTDVGRVSIEGAPVVDRLGAINGGKVAVFPLSVAQRLFDRPGRLDAIYVKPAPGTDVGALRQRLQRAIGDWNGVLTSTDPPPGATVILAGFLPLFSMLAIFGIGIAVVLVYDTVALTVEERRRDLAVVAAMGGRARTVVGGVVMEAAVLGLVGGLLGGLGAIALAHPILGGLSGFSARVAGVSLTVHADATVFVVGAAMGVFLGAVAAWWPARRAMRMDVAAELSNRESRDENAPALRLRRALLFTAAGGAALVLCWFAQRDGALAKWQPPAAEAGMAVASTAFVVAGGAFAPLVLALVLRGRRRASAPARLGLANLVRDPGRTGTMAAAVATPVAIALIIGSFISSIHDGVTNNVLRTSAGYVQATTLPVNNSVNLDAVASPALVDQLARVPGVAGVERSAYLLTGHETGKLIGVKAVENQWRFPYAVFRGTKDRARFERGEVLVGTGLGRRLGLRPGSRLRIATPTGWRFVTVQGIWDDGDFAANSVTMPMSLFESFYGAQPNQGVQLRVAPGATADQVVDAVYAAHLDPALRARSPQVLARTISKDIEGSFSSFWAIQRALLLVAFVAVLATLLLVAVQRRRELALLAAVGMRPSELGRMVVLEAVAVGVVGMLLGAVFAVATYIALHLSLPIFIGYHDPFRVNPSSLPAAAILVIVVIVGAAVLPAWRTARVEVVENLQYE
jgi:putative ABC transport system permease protein